MFRVCSTIMTFVYYMFSRPTAQIVLSVLFARQTAIFLFPLASHSSILFLIYYFLRWSCIIWPCKLSPGDYKSPGSRLYFCSSVNAWLVIAGSLQILTARTSSHNPSQKPLLRCGPASLLTSWHTFPHSSQHLLYFTTRPVVIFNSFVHVWALCVFPRYSQGASFPLVQSDKVRDP